MRYVCQLFFLVCFTLIANAKASAQTGIVTFTFDDASQSQYENAFRVMQEHSLKGTLFAISGGVDASTRKTESFYMTWDNVREMAKAGWEIGAHTHSIPHPDLTKVDDMRLFAELAFAKRRITEEVGRAPESFASPFGEFDARVIAEVKRHYRRHFRAWGGNEGFNPILIEDAYTLGRYDVKSTYTSALVCEAIMRAGNEGKWLVLAFHQVVEEVSVEYQITVETFTRIVQCASALQSEGRISVKTAEETFK